ncbi:MAG: polyketide synthase, partial [Deltaproteobacteria bacterium]|nr:polyketide synthase [Deltaproteobacteria bacterium]
MGGNLLTPYSHGQVRAMEQAYQNAGWSPYDVGLIECHGTGTPVGDTEEASSLVALWGESGLSPGSCAIGSVKSMIGHLLTGAGAAGLIKTLLALNHKTLPPSLNFDRLSKNSPLLNSPFCVQTEATPWSRKDKEKPLRAAVSAFGFGGINAHLLVEQWAPEDKPVFSVPDNITAGESYATDLNSKALVVQQTHQKDSHDIAIVGMASAFGSLESLNDFKEAIFKGDTIIGSLPEYRWKGCGNIAEDYLDTGSIAGGYMEKVSAQIGTFHIPPNEMKDMLPQHLLMLKTAAAAMIDADLLIKPDKETKEDRSRMGVVVGMGFDVEDTNFSQRWNMLNDAKRWEQQFQLPLDEKQFCQWSEDLKDTCGPPLTSSRTVGALGGIMASRIAKEFLFGGPSFVVSCEEASGIKALEIGVRSLQQEEADLYLVGAVDLPGDIRSIITTHKIKPYTKNKTVAPFDRTADGTLPGEGATALVLKRKDMAVKDNDRIYAVIKGMGKASGGPVTNISPKISTDLKEAYALSLERAFDEAKVPPFSVSYIETHGSGDPAQDSMEAGALYKFFSKQTPCDNKPFSKEAIALGAVKANIGHTGAAAGLASVVKTGLCLFQEIMPPLKNFYIPKAEKAWQDDTFHIPAFAQYWSRDRKNGPRRACVSTMTIDGNCAHVILEGYEYPTGTKLY